MKRLGFCGAAIRKIRRSDTTIVKIFESESMAGLIQVFADKLESLDTEITALSKLRKLVDEFLSNMLVNGIKKISTITLLYEETEKRITFEKLSETNREALKLNDIRIIRLPKMRVLTSRLKAGEAEALDGDKMQNLFAKYGFLPTLGLSLREWVNDSDDFEPDEKRSEMLEEILPWDIVGKINKFQQDIFIPIYVKSGEEAK